jgi:hypothetical protein
MFGLDARVHDVRSADNTMTRLLKSDSASAPQQGEDSG